MCGRFVLTASGEELAEAFGLDEAPELAPRYNIAPSQAVAVVRAEPGGRRSFGLLTWGLRPRATAEPKRPHINARSETAWATPAFRDAFARRRCLVPASGFYEWAGTGRGKRQPWYFRMASGRPFAFAGLWEPPFDPADPATATLLTTEPNDLLRPIHDRMPAILAPGDYARWLDPQASGFAALRPLLAPWAPDDLTGHRVGTVVNDARRDEPACIAPSSLL